MSSPSPAKSRWSRMGGAVRRASSVLIATRPNTPSIASDKEADAASVKGAPSTPPKPSILSPPELSHVQQSTAPSPIAESPAREAAASQEDIPVGPSPLAQEPTVPAEPEVSSPQGYVPPPLLDSNTAGLGPGAFVDEPDELPQSHPIIDPSREPSIYAPEAPPAAPVAPPVEDAPAPAPVLLSEPEPELPAPVPEPEPAAIIAPEPEPVPAAIMVSETKPEPAPEPEVIPVAIPVPSPTAPEPETPPPTVGAARSYFDNIPNQDEPIEDLDLSSPPQAVVPDAFKEVVEANAPGRDSAPATETPVAHHEESRELIPEPVAPVPKHSEPPTPAHVPTSMPTVPIPYPMPTYEMNSGEEIWGGVPHKAPEMPRSVLNGNASTRSRASSVHMPLENPFADPPRITVSHMEQPVPVHHPHISEQHQEAPAESHNTANGGIIMPLPALHEVVPTRPINDFASIQSVKSTNHGHMETDETLPLLSQPGSPKASYLRPSAVNVSPHSGAPQHSWAQGYSATHGPRLHDLGWLEYPLPDGTVYYVHPTRRVTTDIDLHIDKKLDAITGYLIHHYRERDSAPAGMELWLREAETKGKRGGKPLPPIRCWVDHHKRSVVIDRLHENGSASGKATPATEDQLDIEYRYWSFMEAHPAHTSLPHTARAEAMDVLTWAWTDRLLPSHRNVPAPFTQEECQELMSLLRSFSDQSDTELQSVVHTRIVSRVLLRVAHWRQKHFRPNKTLPTDVRSSEIQLPKQRKPFRRALVDFVISCMCLGIPYIFFERAHHRMDEESGIRNAAPMLVVGACTCLIVSLFFLVAYFVYRNPSWKAAIVLSASVTFLSLPGLDNISRITGFVAILFSSFSMASTVIALFRYKADLERPISHIGGEGLMMLSRRSVVMSLPLVFLAYAIIGFVVGVVLYSFRGVSITDPLTTKHEFNDYTRWTVVGVLGGLAGMLTTSLLLLRR